MKRGLPVTGELERSFLEQGSGDKAKFGSETCPVVNAK
jgi:hypothetical protein